MPEPSLHHVGYAVPSIADSLARWRTTLCAVAVRGVYDDPLQGARVAFLEFAISPTLIELIEPLGAGGPLARFLEKGGGLHHLCFEVDDLDERIRSLKADGAILVRRPRPAVAFEGRKIAWMLTRERLLTELLERDSHVQ